nr:ABC transporter ATP-binding protein [Vallitalea okinawensis]
MYLLEGNNITKIYQSRKNSAVTKAVDGIDIRIMEGEFVGIMGPSGSGKTTLLNVLSGLDDLTNGELSINQQDLLKMNDEDSAKYRRKNMGFIFQDFNLLDSLTLEENIRLPLILDKKLTIKKEKDVQRIISYLGIEAIKDKYPWNVSGGQQQRTAIAMAMINDPKIIFADEPTGNLDSKSSNLVMRSLQRLNKDEKRTILMVTHDPFAASYCNRILFLVDGRIHLEIIKEGSNNTFFDKILDCFTVMGGVESDF